MTIAGKNGIDTYVQRGLIDRRRRRLLITPELISFEGKNISDPFSKDKLTTFLRSDVSAFRYGIKWISGYQFTIGREYLIFIRNTAGKELKISFKSFYGVRKKECRQQNQEIINALWEFFFRGMTERYYQEFRTGLPVKIGMVTLMAASVAIGEEGKPQKIIPWENVRLKQYATYAAIFSAIEPAKQYAALSYLNDWNTFVLYTLIKLILDESCPS